MKGSKLAKFGGLPGKLEVAGEVGSSKTTKYSNYTHRHTGIVVGKNIRGQPLCKSSFVLQNGRYLLFCLFSCSQRTDRRKQAAIFSFRPKKRQKSWGKLTHTTKLYIFCLTSSSQGSHKNGKQQNKRDISRKKIIGAKGCTDAHERKRQTSD